MKQAVVTIKYDEEKLNAVKRRRLFLWQVK